MNFETAKNIVAVVAPLIAVYIAWRGLSTWNRQLRGTRDSDLSRRILVALYKVETMIRQIRSPFVSSVAGIPSGRMSPLPFGMYCRLTSLAR
jgi:hypothetical protein